MLKLPYFCICFFSLSSCVQIDQRNCLERMNKLGLSWAKLSTSWNKLNFQMNYQINLTLQQKNNPDYHRLAK